MLDKDKIKENLTMEQVYELLLYLEGTPLLKDDRIVCDTICHNEPGEGSYKLYYYENTQLFRCYTECGDAFDIFDLIIKVKKNKGEEWSLQSSMMFVVNFFNLSFEETAFNKPSLPDWEYFNKKTSQSEKKRERKVELKTYSEDLLTHYPQPRIAPWEAEGITHEEVVRHNIRFNPVSSGILIPHYDIGHNLIGIRERTLIREKEKYGKYRPAILSRKMYNHPLSFNLYNLENAKENIKRIKKAIVVEGEKSTLKFASFFGAENDISVAVCGSNLLAYQIDLLKSLGVEEIVIAFDKQYQKIGDEEWEGWTKKLYQIYDKYGNQILISFILDFGQELNYKDSPIDQGKETFIKLFNERKYTF